MQRMLIRTLALSATLLGVAAANPAAACHRCGRPTAPCPTVAMVPQTVTTYCTVTETVVDKVDVTVMKTRFRTEYVEQQVPVKRFAIEEVPVTRMVRRVHKVTDYVPVRAGCCPHGHAPVSCCGAVKQVAVTRCVTECVPVTKLVKRKVPVTEMATRLKPVRIPEQVPVTVTRCVPRKVTRQVPVTRTVMVPCAVPQPVAYAAPAPQHYPTAQAPSPQG